VRRDGIANIKDSYTESSFFSVKLWEIARHLIVSHVPVRKRFKELLPKPLLFWSMERNIMRFTGPFLRCKAVILSVPDLVVRDV
jgi:hypothetical protein